MRNTKDREKGQVTRERRQRYTISLHIIPAQYCDAKNSAILGKRDQVMELTMHHNCLNFKRNQFLRLCCLYWSTVWNWASHLYTLSKPVLMTHFQASLNDVKTTPNFSILVRNTVEFKCLLYLLPYCWSTFSNLGKWFYQLSPLNNRPME